MLSSLKNKILSYLDPLAELTGTDLRYLSRGGFWGGMETIIGNLSSLIFALAVAKFLTKEAYGTYSFILSWTGIFSTFALSGISGAITRSIASGFEGDLQRAIRYKLQWGLISSAISIGFSIYYLMAGNNTLAIGFALVAICLPAYLASSVVSTFLFAKELFRYGTMITLAVRFTSLVTMISTMFFTNSIPLIILTYFVPDTIIRFSFSWWAIKKYQKNRNLSEGTDIFAMHLTAMNIIGGISKRFDSILLFHSFGAVEVAVYKFSLLPFEKIQNLVASVISLASPRFAKRSHEEIYASLGKKLIWFNMLFAALGLAAFLALPVAFKILFPQYMEAVYYGRILLLPFIFVAPAIIHGIWVAKAEIKKLYTMKIITHVSRIVGFAIFIPLYGLDGAVWSQVVIAFFAGFCIIFMHYKDRTKLYGITN